MKDISNQDPKKFPWAVYTGSSESTIIKRFRTETAAKMFRNEYWTAHQEEGVPGFDYITESTPVAAEIPANKELDAKQKLNATLEEAFSMVRSDKEVGRGSCSSVDEATTDQELRAELLKLSESLPGRWKFVPKAYLNKIKEGERIRREYEKDIQNS